MRPDRRVLLKNAIGGLCGLALPQLPRLSFAAGALDIEPLTGELAVLAGAGPNIVVHATNAAQLLVDSGAAGFDEALLATLNRMPGAAGTRTLLNSHWHPDQVGSNLALGQRGATIIAHEKTRLRLATEYYLPDEDRYQAALPPEAQPTVSFYTRGETLAGKERVEYGYLLEAHTDGDIYVYFRDSNVLVAGGAVSPASDPVLDWFGGGCLGGRVDALALLLEISDDETRIVPSDGPVIGRAELQAEHDMMLVLFERMVELVRQGMSPADILEAGAMNDLGREFDDPLAFVYAAHKGLWAHHNTLSHDIV